MIPEVAKRDIRHFYIYKSGVLTLEIEDRPGTLHSVAGPAPAGPPSHPFIHATAFDALSEDEMGRLLGQATSFDNYVELLIKAGYDVVSSDHFHTLSDGFRLEDQQGLVGALWAHGGQFTTLLWQPEPDQLIFNHATLTVYQKDRAEQLFNQLQSTKNFEELRSNLEALGFRLMPLEDKSN